MHIANDTNQMKKERIKWYVYLIVLEIILWGFFFGYLNDRIPGYATHVGDNTSYQIIHDFTSDYVVEQRFSSPRDFEFITLNFADHDMHIAGKMQFEVYNNQGECLIVKEIVCSELKYNEYGKEVNISFQEQGGGKARQEYKVIISARETESVALGIYGYDVSDGQSRAVVNGEEKSFAVSIGIHTYTQVFKILAAVVMLICLSGMVVTVWICTKENIAEETRFLTLAVPLGICMLLFLSVNGVYDADAHTNMTYHYSNVILGTDEEDNAGRIYMRMEDATAGREKSGVINEQAQEYWRVLRDWSWSVQNKDSVVLDVTMAHGGTMLSYLPNVIGMVIGRVLNLGAYPMFYLSKLLGFIAYVMTCYLAIKVTPILKTVFTFTAALPVCIHHATGITYDTIAFSASLVMCAYIFLWWERELSLKEWVILAVSVIFVGGCKGGVYVPLVLLLGLVPWKRWNFSWKKAMVLLSFLGGAAVLFWIKYGSILIDSMGSVEDFSNPSSKYGAGYCFKHPIIFIKMFMETMFIRSDAYLGHILGDRTPWTQSHVEWVVIIPFLLLILSAGIRKETETELMDNVKKLFVVALLVAEFIGMHIVLMSDTKIYSSYIYGVQGRYFLPLVPLAVLVLREHGLTRKSGAENKLYIFYSMLQGVYMISLMDKYF